MGIFISKKLRYFIAIMEKRSFASASEELCITRSPLSKAITEIEEYLDDKLFVRKHNDLIPTPLALEYYKKCKPLYEELLKLEKIKNLKLYTVIFDSCFPLTFVKFLRDFIEVPGFEFRVEHTIITPEHLLSLKNENKIFISLKNIVDVPDENKSIWPTGGLTLLSPFISKNNNLFVCKEIHINSLKNRFSKTLENYLYSINFIEHNHDPSTLIYKVKSGEGHGLFSSKLAQFYNLNGIKKTPIKEYNKNIVVYHDASDLNSIVLLKIKQIL
ncbi:TPA: LysR family transcriptional regulator, partial [Salmonella enterica]|nr:LysR family transcriptional regulator [Salmonella enterica]HCL5321329.1 LysR family transcriptional regulator [Salmonella enterica]HCL5329924.1 LysR family transcriptional regulator [Salmonella enterica]HCL5359297.1 LysR family transcriptional regulator [Salmonella enterica]HCL5376096.1 LysR family transcriptional regulator [Salmonella enterica]